MPTELQRSAASPNNDLQQLTTTTTTAAAVAEAAAEQQQAQQQRTQAQQDHEDRKELLEKMEFGKEVAQLNGEMSSSQTSTTSSTSLNGSISNGSGRKSSIISPDPTPYVTKARVTRPTPPPPSYNPMQFVQIKPCNLYQTAQQQLKKAEEVKKIKEIKKEEPEDWQNNLDNWKSSRRKRVEHIIDRVVEVKKLELEEHDRSRRKSKTFSEMIEERGERGGARGLTKLASLAVYNEEESNDFSDLGIGTSSASGKSSLSEDYDNNSVTSENAELDKAIFENKQKENSIRREYISSPGYDTSSSTAPASSPDPCEYTYEGAIQDYKQRVSRATNSATISTASNYNKFEQNKASTVNVAATAANSTTAAKPSATRVANTTEGYKNGHSESYPTRRGSKIEDRLSGFEVTSPSDTQENAENKKVDVPKIDITKRKEIFEQQQLQKQLSETKPLSNGGSNGIPKVTLRDRFKFDDSVGNETQQQQAAKKEVKRLSGDITSIKERLQSLEQQKNTLNNGSSAANVNDANSGNKPSVDVPVASLKDRLSSLQNAVSKEEVRKPPVALIDARQLEIMKSEEEKLKKQQQQQLAEQEQQPSFSEGNVTMESVDRDDSGIHTADDIDTEGEPVQLANDMPQQALPEPEQQAKDDQLSAAIAALELEELQLEQAANAVNQIEAEFAELNTITTPAAVPAQKHAQPQQTQAQSQTSAATTAPTSTSTSTPFNNLDFSEINEALDSAIEATLPLPPQQTTPHDNAHAKDEQKPPQATDQQLDQHNDDDQIISENVEQNQLPKNEFESKMNAMNSEVNKLQIDDNNDDNNKKILNILNEVATERADATTEKFEREKEIFITNEPIYQNVQTTQAANGDSENIPAHYEQHKYNNNNTMSKNNNNNNNINNLNNTNISNKLYKQQNNNNNKQQQQETKQELEQVELMQQPADGQISTTTTMTTNAYNRITTTTAITTNDKQQHAEQIQQIKQQNMGAYLQQEQQQQAPTLNYHNNNNNTKHAYNNSNMSNNNNTTAADNEPYYQVPKSSEPYYDAPKHLRPIPVYENIDVFYNGLENATLTLTTTTGITTTNDSSMKLQPPKEKPPPPPIESPPLFDDVDSIDSKTDMTWSSSENTYETIHANNKQQQQQQQQQENNGGISPPIKRMNSTKRIKKELRNKRSSFLGIEDSFDNDESYLELTVAPPPDMAQLLQEERRLEKQLYLKAGLCDSSDTGESRDSGVSENHSRQSSEHYTNLSDENVNQLEALPQMNATNEMMYHNDAHIRLAAQTPLLQTVKGNSAESWTESATAAAAATKSLTEAQATANAKMLSIEEKIREQEEVLRVERELLQFSQEELKRQRENLLLRENMARRELQHGAKMLMSANRHSLQDLNGLEASLGGVTNPSAMLNMTNGYQSAFIQQQSQQHHTNAILRPQHIYANIPNLQQQYYQHADLDYRKSMSDLNEFSKRLTVPQATQQQQQQQQQPLILQAGLPPVPPTKPMRAMHVATTNGHGHAHFNNATHAQHADEYTARQRHSLTALNPNAYAGSLVKIATTQATNTTNTSTSAAIMRTHNSIASYQQHTQSAQNLNQLPQLSNGGGQHVIHHGNMTRNTLHALSATPKPKYTDDWVQVQTRKTFENPKLANDPAWLSAYQQKRKSMPDAYNHGYSNHWMVQEAEQRRLIEQQKQQLQLTRRSIPNGKTMLPANMSNNPSNATTNGSNGKPLPDAIIQTLTERVQSKGLGERKRFDNSCNTSNNSSPAHTAMPAVYHQQQQQQHLKQQQQLPSAAVPNLRYASHNMNNSKNNATQTATTTATSTTKTTQMNTQEKVLSVSGKKKCSHCGEELGRGAAMIIESLLLFYHINCFKCCVCHVQLGDGLNGTDVRVRNHKLHCQNCYSSDDGIKFSCV